MAAVGPLVEDDRALADELHSERVEVPGPLVQSFAERLAGEVRVPLRGMRERIRGQRGEDPALAAARFGPLEDALVRIALVEREPAHEHRGVAAIVQMLGRSEDHPLRHFVLGELTVSVHPAPLRGDDVGRIARDQVERLAFHWVEEAALAAFDVAESVQSGVELGVGDRAGVDIGGDHVPGMLRGEQRVDAASRSDVERSVDTRARRQGIENTGCGRVGRDIVGRVVAVTGEAVRGEHDLADRQDPDTRNDLLADLRKSGRLQSLHARWAESGLRLLR